MVAFFIVLPVKKTRHSQKKYEERIFLFGIPMAEQVERLSFKKKESLRTTKEILAYAGMTLLEQKKLGVIPAKAGIPKVEMTQHPLKKRKSLRTAKEIPAYASMSL